MDISETVREELIKQLNEIEGELWLRSSTFVAYTLFGIVIIGISIWRLLAGDGWWALGFLGGFGVFVGSAALWVYGKMLSAQLNRRIAAVERNWPSARDQRLDEIFGE